MIGFSRCAGSQRAIYVPDNAWGPAEHAMDGVFERATFEEIRSKLLNEAGPPASLVSDAVDDGDLLRRLGRNCYFIDSFAD